MAKVAVVVEADSLVSPLDRSKVVDPRLEVPCCLVRIDPVACQAGSLATAGDNPAARHDFPIVDLNEILLDHMLANWHSYRPKFPDHSDNYHTHNPGMIGHGSSLVPGLSSRTRWQGAPGHAVVGVAERPAVDKPLR